MTKSYGQLLRVLGVAFGWAVTVGNTIGAGILRAPGEVAHVVPSYPLFFTIWIAGGLYALLGAVSLAELGAMITQSGGQTVFVRRAFGPYPGFAVAWSDWLSTCASAAAITIVLVEAIASVEPGITAYRNALIGGIVAAFALAQWRGIRTGSMVQLITSGLKALAFLALVLACFLVDVPERVAAVGPASALTLAGIIVAFQAMIYTYDGWSGVLYFSGEMTNPGRDIPRSMFSGVISVTAIYLLVNLAFLRLIPLEAMAGDEMVAKTASQLVFGPAGIAVIGALIAISLLSAINACILMATRVLYASGAAPRVNVGGTPTTALGVTTIVTLVFALTGTFNQVIGVAAFFFVANYAMSFASVFRLRKREPDTPRPYRAWGYPVTTGVMLIVSIAFLLIVIAGDPRNGAAGVVLLALSYPIYRVLLSRTNMELS